MKNSVELGTGVLRWSAMLGDLALCVELLPLRWGRDSHMQGLTTLTMQGALGYCLAIN